MAVCWLVVLYWGLLWYDYVWYSWCGLGSYCVITCDVECGVLWSSFCSYGFFFVRV